MAPWLEPWQALTWAESGVEGQGLEGPGPGGAGPQGPPPDVHDVRAEIAANCTAFLEAYRIGAGTKQQQGEGEREGTREGRNITLDEFQIIKAVVLALVTSIILLSICKMVFQLFVRYAGKADDR